ncbi:glycosyltransferase family 1 protein [Haemophilus paracuniculus]|uniref:Glycosyltransferase family 1 protein n=1 Tax=Haemophilus paracuniculus TaxID=734 RepID=A0A1T0ATB9_9PAST|nr:glycosyltransferase family 4 protein [Haemophilus paracuniculus]OOR99856.1 glycosyltransferase family 1 protein [Haemophilus paracuniculus]
MKKIAFVTTVASSIYGFRGPLIKQLLQEGYTIYAFVSEYSEQELTKIKSMGVEVITYPLKRGGLNPFADILASITLSKHLKQINPDVVFSFFTKAVIFGTFAAKLAKTPKIIGMLEGLGFTFTEQPDGIRLKTKIIKLIQIVLYKLSLPLLDKFIVLNPDDEKDLLEKYGITVKEKHILGGIGIDLSEYPYSEIDSNNIDDKVNFLFIGRLLKEKGINEFIQAAKYIKSKYPQTKFTVLGSIDKENLGAISEEQLNALINLGIIEYPGQVTNIVEWITKSHIFVLPSYREGVPRSTQEAMAIGRAIITTDVPGCRETVEDGVNGFLVKPWDAQDLADKMEFFIKNPHSIVTMGQESYRIAQQKFDITKVNQRLIDIIEA